MAKTIPLEDLRLVLIVARMRKHNNGRTCRFAITTPQPILQSTCSGRHRMVDPERVKAIGLQRSNFGPMQRGYMAEVIERTRMLHGLPEVRKTWRAGLRALLAENRFILNGGAQ